VAGLEADDLGLTLAGTINGQAETGQQKWNDLLAKNLRKYIKAHPDEFPSSGNDEDVDGEPLFIRLSSVRLLRQLCDVRCL
jgi:hypothetical protein